MNLFCHKISFAIKLSFTKNIRNLDKRLITSIVYLQGEGMDAKGRMWDVVVSLRFPRFA